MASTTAISHGAGKFVHEDEHARLTWYRKAARAMVLFLVQPTHSLSLAVTRVAFALFVFFNQYKPMIRGLARATRIAYDGDALLSTAFEQSIPFYYFDWLRDLCTFICAKGGSSVVIWIPQAVNIASVCMALGIFTRTSSIACCVLYWCLLLFASDFVNHYYMKGLVLLLLAIFPEQYYTLDNFVPWLLRKIFRYKGNYLSCPRPEAPRVVINLLRFQVLIVYFFGSIQKIQEDWLRGMPFRLFMQHAYRSRTVTLFLVDYFGIMTVEQVALFISYTGVVFDMAICFALVGLVVYPPMYGKTARLLNCAVILVMSAIFHGINAYLLGHIGQFPKMMIVALTLFFPRDWPILMWHEGIRFMQSCGVIACAPSLAPQPFVPVKHTKSVRYQWKWKHAVIVAIACVYVTHQVVNPIRFTLGTEGMWLGAGNEMTWRMMMIHISTVQHDLIICDEGNNTLSSIPMRRLLVKEDTSTSVASSVFKEQATHSPMYVVQSAHKVAALLRLRGVNAKVYFDVMTSWNGRPPQRRFKPGVDLAALDPWTDRREILAAYEPLSDELREELNPLVWIRRYWPDLL